ncbi:MAG TPA: 50S ribosomal protein L11 [Patescibacteria group bacterium]|nr:50S ribosomal protein L11 [Patescibacteria group bacterium]
MAKTIKTKIKLQVPAAEANPAPPVGPTLGQHGLNIMEFCNQFNERTQDKKGTILPVEITVYEDRTFDFIIKTPPVAEMIKKTLNLEKGSGIPNKNKVGKLTWAQVEAIAKDKMPDLQVNDVEAAKKIVAGTARSMGVDVA